MHGGPLSFYQHHKVSESIITFCRRKVTNHGICIACNTQHQTVPAHAIMEKMWAGFLRDVSKLHFATTANDLEFKFKVTQNMTASDRHLFTMLHAISCMCCVCVWMWMCADTLQNWHGVNFGCEFKQNANACGIQYTLKHHNCHLTLSKSWL